MDLLQLKVREIIPETTDTITMVLESNDGKKINYQAGQFLTFIFNHGDKEIRRSYSFSSTPGIDDFPAITIKRITNGEISRLLQEQVKKDDCLTSLQPSGRFTIETDKNASRQIFFITAGSGITPVFSLLKKILVEEPMTKIFLIYQNHDENNIIFKKQLARIEKKYPQQLKWINLLSKPKKHPHTSHRLTNILLEKIVLSNLSANRKVLFYLCGPAALMRVAQFTLRLMGFPDDSIRRENFTVEFIPPAPLISDIAPRQVIIHYQQHKHIITVTYPDNILQAALKNNIQLPYSCRGGRCSTCVAKLINGKIKMSINEVLTDKDLEQGLVLTCVGYAESDIELEF